MKKVLAILTLLALMMGQSTSVKAQQTWDFAQTFDADVAALTAATSEWTYTEASARFENKNAISGALMAGNTELQLTKGLTFEAAANKLRIDVGKRVQLAGKNVKINIPGLKAGQVVTIVFASTGNTAVTFDANSNLSGLEGFAAADKNTTQAGTGTVAEDGVVTFASTGGSINVLSIAVSEAPEAPVTDYSVAPNSKVNQAMLTLKSQETKYYNTEDLDAIDFTDEGVRVTPKDVDGFDLYGDVLRIDFNKADGQGGEEPVNPVVTGDVKITEAKGWLESAYVKFEKLDGVKSYNVYVKGGQYNEYTKIDRELVREYKDYGRADVVGLMAGTYAIKVVPVNAEGAELDKYGEATDLEVKSYSRQGFAFMNGYAPGAYNLDGTLKRGAKVFYVTAETAKTITTTVAGANQNPCVGIQQIIEGYEKGGDTTPIAFRFIGLVTADDIDFFGSKEEGIQVKGRKADSELNLTFEGIGDDATIKGFGFLVRNAKSVEFRNLGIMRCMDDGVSLDTDNSNIWVHHMDMFYGKHGSGDHDKGDGQVDVKTDSKYVTVSYNRFWDTGKTNMFGMKSESGPNYISYDHNWFDHSDSRHPRVRTMSVHVWNNYFDNNAKYGVGATTGASVFVENNYFLKTKKPILSSLQGTDGEGSGTFSGEEGGMIKAYGNYFDRAAAKFKYYTQNNPSASKGYDAYETTTRDEQVPETEKTLVGGHTYNNFDTNAQLMYEYTVDAAADVPAIVMGYYGAGRMNHGDFTYTFKDNIGDDDADSAYDATLGGLLDNYKSQLLGIFGDDNQQSGGGEGGEGGEGGDEPTPVPEGIILASFDGSPSNTMFTVGGDYGDGKITYDGTYYKKGVKFNSNGSITFTPQKNYQMTLVLATSKNGRDVSINGTKTTVSGTANTEGAYYELQPIAITAGTEYKLTKGSVESIVMLIKLEPEE
ncbi:MAG: pectate lyase [Prevotella sp.]|nr:pectate lyase [Prevotella sp.]